MSLRAEVRVSGMMKDEDLWRLEQQPLPLPPCIPRARAARALLQPLRPLQIPQLLLRLLDHARIRLLLPELSQQRALVRDLLVERRSGGGACHCAF